MADCEIVENTACGQAFKYCRTHKVEPQDCPGAAPMITATQVLDSLNNYEIAPRHMAARSAWRLVNRDAWELRGAGRWCVDYKSDFEWAPRPVDESHPFCQDCINMSCSTGILYGIRGRLTLEWFSA